jgi:hypothetical protein
VLAERDRHVLDRAELNGIKPLRPAHQLGQAGAIALHQRETDDLHLATAAPSVDGDLKFGRSQPASARDTIGRSAG